MVTLVTTTVNHYSMRVYAVSKGFEKVVAVTKENGYLR